MNATTRSQPYRIASTVISIAALAVLIAGVPYLLWQLGGWPFPTSVPTVDAIRDALSRPIPDTVIVDVGWKDGPKLQMSRSGALDLVKDGGTREGK